jgi:hypothetical protein
LEELKEKEYYTLRQMARHMIGLYYPAKPIFLKDDDVWWKQAENWCKGWDLDQATLHSLAGKGQILKREARTKKGFLCVQYALSFEKFQQIDWDLNNEAKRT